MRYVFSVYAILIVGLGAMFTRSYRLHDLAANTVYCGETMSLQYIYRPILSSVGGLLRFRLIFRFPNAPDDHHELHPFGLHVSRRG